MILKRSSLLSLLLVTTTALVGTKIYQIWEEELPVLSRLGGEKASFSKQKRRAVNPQLAHTTSIVERNLFDPKRGARSVKKAKPFPEVKGLSSWGQLLLAASVMRLLRSRRKTDRVLVEVNAGCVATGGQEENCGALHWAIRWADLSS